MTVVGRNTKFLAVFFFFGNLISLNFSLCFQFLMVAVTSNKRQFWNKMYEILQVALSTPMYA